MRYLLIITMLVMSCNTPKNNFGYVSIDDENSRNIIKLFEAVENEEIGYLKEIFSKDLKFTDPNGTVLNKDEFIAVVENIFDMFEDVEFEDSEYSDYDGLAVETTFYSNGQVWTNIWSAFKGKGKYTGNDVRFPFHISYLWKDGKIIEEVQFFSTKVFDAENEAKNNQLK
tara:strand:- start:231 stop:740 length:510 start_codon:yes stop_codon:yes gene_type:complete